MMMMMTSKQTNHIACRPVYVCVCLRAFVCLFVSYLTCHQALTLIARLIRRVIAIFAQGCTFVLINK